MAQRLKHLRGNHGQATPGRLCPQQPVLPGGDVSSTALAEVCILNSCIPAMPTTLFFGACVFNRIPHKLSLITLPALKDAQHPGTHVSVTAHSPKVAQPSSWNRHAAAKHANPNPARPRYPLAPNTPTQQYHRCKLPNSTLTGTGFCLLNKMSLVSNLLNNLGSLQFGIPSHEKNTNAKYL